MKRLPMRKIREALKLRADGYSTRRVAQSLSFSRTTIIGYYQRFETAGLSWPLPDEVSDNDLEQLLFLLAPNNVFHITNQILRLTHETILHQA